MCEVVEYSYNGERMFATAGAHGSRLPVIQPGGIVLMVPWGAQGRTFHHEPRSVRIQSEEPCVPLDTIKRGAWAELEPKPVRIPVRRFMVLRQMDAATLDHWTFIGPGEYLQGALLRRGVERAVYVVTVEPPAHLEVLSPWPRIVRLRPRKALLQ